MSVAHENNVITFQSTDNKVSLSVRFDEGQETVWLNLTQIADLFQRDKSVISRHIKKLFDSEEMDRKSAVAFFATVQEEGGHQVTRNIEYFNLDVILGVGYRVNSKVGSEFRRWASKILKDYLLKGYSLNEERLLTVSLNDISRSLEILKQSLLTHECVNDIGHAAIEIIRAYTKSWHVLYAYDEDRLGYPQLQKSAEERLVLEDCIQSIARFKSDLMKQKEASELFGQQREAGLIQVFGNIHQTFDGKFLYPSIYERAAHLFYFVIKDHPFVDGNKRIGSFLLLLYLTAYDMPLSNLSSESLVALALLVAQSQPSDKEIMVKLVLNLIAKD